MSTPPQHLSEFYSFINPNSTPARTPIASLNNSHHSPLLRRTNSSSTIRSSCTTATSSSISSSSTFNTSNILPPSKLSRDKVMTPSDLSTTVSNYSHLLTSAGRYREALMVVSSAAAEFGHALESTSRSKGVSPQTADGLTSAGGLHYLVSNHQRILADSIERAFEVPLKKTIKKFKRQSKEFESNYRMEISSRSKILKQTELQNMRLAKRRNGGLKNLDAYKLVLEDLTNQINQMDILRNEYFETVFDLTKFTNDKILSLTGAVVRAEMEIYEGIAKKGWSGGGLDDLIAVCSDPFNEEDLSFGNLAGTDVDDSAVSTSHIEQPDRFDEMLERTAEQKRLRELDASSSNRDMRSRGSSFSSAVSRYVPTSPSSSAMSRIVSRAPPSSFKSNLFSILPSSSIFSKPFMKVGGYGDSKNSSETRINQKIDSISPPADSLDSSSTLALKLDFDKTSSSDLASNSDSNNSSTFNKNLESGESTSTLNDRSDSPFRATSMVGNVNRNSILFNKNYNSSHDSLEEDDESGMRGVVANGSNCDEDEDDDTLSRININREFGTRENSSSVHPADDQENNTSIDYDDSFYTESMLGSSDNSSAFRSSLFSPGFKDSNSNRTVNRQDRIFASEFEPAKKHQQGHKHGHHHESTKSEQESEDDTRAVHGHDHGINGDVLGYDGWS